MKWFCGCFAVLGIGLLCFRPLIRRPKAEVAPLWTLPLTNVTFDAFRFRNCSFATCLSSRHCMLEYGKLSVFLQPIIKIIDENGNLLTPAPSEEFHAVRKALLQYSVSEPDEACIFFPGVDFLNLHRFSSVRVAESIASALIARFHNVLLFTLIGQWEHTNRNIMASGIIPRHMYRHRLDISLPPYFSPRNLEKPHVRHNLVIMLFNASTSYQEEGRKIFAHSKDATVLSDCEDHQFSVCDTNGNRVNWENVVQEASFVLLHERMMHFGQALYRALEASVIPVIYAPNLILPFSDYIDWHLISIRPASVSRVLDVIKELDTVRLENMRSQIRNIYGRFSSIHGLVKMTVRVLETRLLPVKGSTYEQRNMLRETIFALPHLEHPARLSMITWSNSSAAPHTLEDVKLLAASQLLSSTSIIWNDEIVPLRESWEATIPTEIITGIKRIYDIRSVVKQGRDDVLLFTPLGRCGLDGKVLRKAFNIWRTLPDRAVIIPCVGTHSYAVIMHKMLFTSAAVGHQVITGPEVLFSDILRTHRTIYVVTRDNANGTSCFKKLNCIELKAKKMQSVLFAVGAVYFLLVANFYNESHGFKKQFNGMYAVWKVLPILFLTGFAAVHGGGLSRNSRNMCAMALFFGGIGDVLIGLSRDGIVPGAIAFGMGHLMYMAQFLPLRVQIYWPLLIGTLIWAAVVGQMCVFPMLPEHPFSVTIMTIYSLILSACLAITGSQYFNRRAKDDEKGLLVRFLGFALFYVSDSVLIMAHTGYKIPLSEAVILGTYYCAQYFILYGNIHTGLHTKAKTI